MSDEKVVQEKAAYDGRLLFYSNLFRIKEEFNNSFGDGDYAKAFRMIDRWRGEVSPWFTPSNDFLQANKELKAVIDDFEALKSQFFMWSDDRQEQQRMLSYLSEFIRPRLSDMADSLQKFLESRSMLLPSKEDGPGNIGTVRYG